MRIWLWVSSCRNKFSGRAKSACVCTNTWEYVDQAASESLLHREKLIELYMYSLMVGLPFRSISFPFLLTFKSRQQSFRMPLC